VCVCVVLLSILHVFYCTLCTIDYLCREKLDDNIMNRTVEFIVELVKILDNILHISNDVFSLADIRNIISFLYTS